MSKADDVRIWARFSVDFADNPKIACLSDAAFRTLVEMILYSRLNLTDGVIPANLAARRWGYKKTESVTESVTQSVTESVTQSVTQSVTDPVTELLNNSPDKPSLTRLPDGNLLIHDYLKHQESKKDVTARKARNLANGRKGGRPRKTQSVTESVTESVTQSLTETKTETITETKTRDRDRDRGEITNVISLSGNQSENTSPPTNTSGEKERKKRGTRIPEDFTITNQMRLWATSRRLSININEQTELFINYWMSTPGERGVKIDWYATWRNWMLNADKRERDKQTSRYRNQDQIMRDSYAEAARADALLGYTQQPTQNLWDDFNNQQHRLNGA